MKYVELTVHTTTEAREILADIMWGYTDFGVTICDRNDIIALQKSKDTMYWDYMDDNLAEDKPSDVLVKCYVEADTAEQVIRSILGDIATAKENCGGALPFGTLEDTKRMVDGDDWIDVWKKHFRPIHLGRIVVVPEWIEYTPAEGELIVLLDSNMAFGTGEHETTSSVVELMQEYVQEDSVCIDVGCGSGILGISAIKLGAKKAYLTDIDEVAELLDLEIPEGDFDTLGGFLMSKLGRIPDADEHPQVEFENAVFTVQSMDDRRIESVHIEVFPKPEQDDDDE